MLASYYKALQADWNPKPLFNKALKFTKLFTPHLEMLTKSAFKETENVFRNWIRFLVEGWEGKAEDQWMVESSAKYMNESKRRPEDEVDERRKRKGERRKDPMEHHLTSLKKQMLHHQ